MFYFDIIALMAGNLILKNLYKIGRKLKEDRIGIVYEALYLPNNTLISVREYHRKFCHASIVDKLQGAIYQLSLLNHPNIVKIIDSEFLESERFFIVYDTPYQGSLADILEKIERFSEEESINIIKIILKALEYAHQKKIIHGALNPENILMQSNGEIKLINFYTDALLNHFSLSKESLLLNPLYLPPEQLKGETLRKSSDLFSVGILAYKMLSGHNPYPQIESIPMILRNLQRHPESLIIRNPGLSKYLEDIIFKAVEYNPGYRQQSALEMLGDFNSGKVTIRVEEIKMREALKKQQKTTPAIQSTTAQEIELPPMKKTENRQTKSFQYNNHYAAEEPATKKRAVTMKNININKKVLAKNLFYLFIGLSFLGISIAIVNSLFVSYFTSIPKLEIPQLTGLPEEEAILKLEDLGLKQKIAGYVNSDTITSNHVVSTIPASGRVVKKYRLVKLFISKGNEQLLIPDLIESHLNNVRKVVEDKGFVLNIKARHYNRELADNIIISQTPSPNTPADKGTAIDVIVSAGYPVAISLVDKSEDTAIVKVGAENLPSWEAQKVVIYLQDKSGRYKYFEKTIEPGEKLVKEITTEPDAVIEVYYFEDLALKQELKYL